MEQFTANEVRDLSERGADAMQQFIDGRHTLHIPPQSDDADMVIVECLRAMDAFADLLEAREKAEPVGEVVGVAGSYGEMRMIRWRDKYSPAVGTKLYTRSAPAQPPAARVTDAMVNAAMRADFCGHNVADALMCGTDWNTEVMRAALEAALAAQENPNG